MKEMELRRHTTCDVCRQKLGQTGLLPFWTVMAQRYGFKMDALCRQQGLAMMLGGEALLANIMGPDEDLAERLGEPIEITVCDPCMTGLSKKNEGPIGLLRSAMLRKWESNPEGQEEDGE